MNFNWRIIYPIVNIVDDVSVGCYVHHSKWLSRFSCVSVLVIILCTFVVVICVVGVVAVERFTLPQICSKAIRQISTTNDRFFVARGESSFLFFFYFCCCCQQFTRQLLNHMNSAIRQVETHSSALWTPNNTSFLSHLLNAMWSLANYIDFL